MHQYCESNMLILLIMETPAEGTLPYVKNFTHIILFGLCMMRLQS